MLGEGHFATRIDALEHERILWEGGASRPATLIRLARYLTPVLLIIAFYALMFLPIILIDAAPEHRDHSAAHASAARPDPREVTPESRIEAQRQAERSRTVALTFIGIIAGFVLLALLTTVVVAVLQTRTAWYVVTSERICIQSGALTKSLLVLDLDKVISVQANASLLERWAGLQSIELTHAGSQGRVSGPWLRHHSPSIAFIRSDQGVFGRLLNEWLPRDNRVTR